MQELAEHVPKGHIPRTMTIHFRGELTRKVRFLGTCLWTLEDVYDTFYSDQIINFFQDSRSTCVNIEVIF